MRRSQITQAVILCAGLGTRLRPLTDKVPKPMIPICGKPLLEHTIDGFRRAGIREFFINLHYLPYVIKAYCGDGSKWGVKIKYAFEEKIRGTAGGIKNFEKDLNDCFFVIYGDIFSRVDYKKMKESFFAKPETSVMEIIGGTDHPLDSDLVEVAHDLRFIKIHKKPHTRLPNNWESMLAVFIFSKDTLHLIPKEAHYEIDHDLLPDLLEKGHKIYGYKTHDYLADIGTPERYREARAFAEKLN